MVGEKGKIVWLENLGGNDVTFAPEKLILEINSPKFVIGFNFESAQYPGKQFDRLGLASFLSKDLLLGSDKALYVARFENGKMNVSPQPIFEQLIGENNPIRFLQITNFNGGKPDFIWSDSNSTHYLLGDQNDPYYTSGTPFEFEVDGRSYAMHSMVMLEINDSTRLMYFNSIANQSSGVELNQIRVPNDISQDGPLEFVQSFEGINLDQFGKLGLAELDAKKDYISYEILENGGTDYRFFDIARFRESGMLFFKSPPDFEDMQDYDQDGLYSLDIDVSKKISRGGDELQVASKTIYVEVLDSNEPPRLLPFTDNDPIKHPEHFPVIGYVNYENPETFSIVGEQVRFSLFGKNQGFFDVNETNGKLSFRSAPNFEEASPVNHRYEIGLKIEEVNGVQSDSINMTIEIENGDDPPQFSPTISNGAEIDSLNSSISFSVDEDNVKVIYLTDLNASDNPANNDPGISRFVVSKKPDHGELWFSVGGNPVTKLDAYDAPLDQNFSGVELYYLPEPNYSGKDSAVITCFNRSSHIANDLNLSDQLTIHFNVESINDEPVITLPNEVTIEENATFVQNLKNFGSDPDDNFLGWEIVEPEDKKYFEIVDETLKAKTSAAGKPLIDFERQEKHFVELRLSSGTGNRKLTTLHTLIVNLENVPDEDPESKYFENFENSRGVARNIKIAEKSISVANLDITDPDGFGVLAKQLNGRDANLFSLSEDGNLSVHSDYPDGLPFVEGGSNLYFLELSLKIPIQIRPMTFQ